MKKILCAAALAALVVPTSANAINLYDKDGLKYDFGGSWKIKFMQEVGDNKDLDLVFGDLELRNGAEYDLGNNMTAFGRVDFGLKKAANDSNNDDRAHLEEAYLGIGVSATSILFGKTDGAADNFGVADAEENPVADDVFDEYGATGGDDLIKFETKIGDMVTLVADHEIAADSSNSNNNGKFFSLYAQADVAGFAFGAAFQNFDPTAVADENGVITAMEDYNMFGVSLAYDAGFVSVGADYSIQEDSNTNPERTITNIVVGAPIGEYIKIVGGYVMLDSDRQDEDEDTNGWYVNFNYHLPMQKNVGFFAEIEDNDAENSDMGFLMGMKMAF